MPIIRVDTYPGQLNSVEVRLADSPYTLTNTVSALDITEVTDGVYEVNVGNTSGNLMLSLFDSESELMGIKYASTTYLQAADYPPWIVLDTLAGISQGVADLGGSPDGSETVIINIDDPDGNQVSNVACYITSDSAGNTVVRDNLYSNAEGQITVRLDPGTYYIWVDHDAYTENNPLEYTVTASG